MINNGIRKKNQLNSTYFMFVRVLISINFTSFCSIYQKTRVHKFILHICIGKQVHATCPPFWFKSFLGLNLWKGDFLRAAESLLLKLTCYWGLVLRRNIWEGFSLSVFGQRLKVTAGVYGAELMARQKFEFLRKCRSSQTPRAAGQTHYRPSETHCHYVFYEVWETAGDERFYSSTISL